MSSKYQKQYLNAQIKEKIFENGGSILDVNLCVSDAKSLFWKSPKTGKYYLRFNIAARKEIGAYGDSHYAYISVKVDPDKEVFEDADSTFDDREIPDHSYDQAAEADHNERMEEEANKQPEIDNTEMVEGSF